MGGTGFSSVAGCASGVTLLVALELLPSPILLMALPRRELDSTGTLPQAARTTTSVKYGLVVAVDDLGVLEI